MMNLIDKGIDLGIKLIKAGGIFFLIMIPFAMIAPDLLIFIGTLLFNKVTITLGIIYFVQKNVRRSLKRKRVAEERSHRFDVLW